MKLKKPKFWELDKPNLLAYLLFPFTIFAELNNYFLNKKTKKNEKKLKTICVGNIYLGGTGKTPLAIKLYQKLEKLNYKVCIGKKFYKDQIDEQTLIQKNADIIIDKSRKNLINRAIKNDVEVLIFDDGLQDRKTSYDIEIVCFDSECWIGNGFLIPSGPLREKVTSLKKYNAVFLKSIGNENKDIINQINIINPNIKIFYSTYYPTNLEEFNISNKYLIFSGIGNPRSFKDLLLKNKLNIVKEIIFPDHYEYNQRDIKFLKKKALEFNAKIITTEKDFNKIPDKDKIDINYLKIDLKINNEEELSNFLKKALDE